MRTFTVITSTRFLDIIEIIHQTIEIKTNTIKMETEKLKNVKQQLILSSPVIESPLMIKGIST